MRNLAFAVLARISRGLPDDWQARYGYRPPLLKTFAQSDHFAGTSYRAANWTHVGQTQGRGKLDVHNVRATQEDIWTSGSTRSGTTSTADYAILGYSSPPADRMFTYHKRILSTPSPDCPLLRFRLV